jgi:hypothetical protein
VLKPPKLGVEQTRRPRLEPGVLGQLCAVRQPGAGMVWGRLVFDLHLNGFFELIKSIFPANTGLALRFKQYVDQFFTKLKVNLFIKNKFFEFTLPPLFDGG